MTVCLGCVAILLMRALTFETGLVAEGLWATADGTTPQDTHSRNSATSTANSAAWV